MEYLYNFLSWNDFCYKSTHQSKYLLNTLLSFIYLANGLRRQFDNLRKPWNLKFVRRKQIWIYWQTECFTDSSSRVLFPLSSFSPRNHTAERVWNRRSKQKLTSEIQLVLVLKINSQNLQMVNNLSTLEIWKQVICNYDSFLQNDTCKQVIKALLHIKLHNVRCMHIKKGQALII